MLSFTFKIVADSTWSYKESELYSEQDTEVSQSTMESKMEDSFFQTDLNILRHLVFKGNQLPPIFPINKPNSQVPEVSITLIILFNSVLVNRLQYPN